MFVYIFILSLILYNIYRFDIRKVEHNKLQSFYWIIFLLFLVAGLRYHIGIDTMRYARSFESTPSLFSLKPGDINLEELSQPLWFFINSFFRSFTDNFLSIQLFHSAIFHVLLARFILNVSKKPFTVLGVVYCVAWWNFSFEIMRESLCVVIYVNALLSLEKRDYKAYLLSALIAMGIHWFSFVVFIITPLVNLCGRRMLFIVLLIIGVFVFIMDTSSISNMIYSLTALADGDASDRMIMYLESDTNGVVTISLLGTIFILATQVIYPILVSNVIAHDKKLVLFSKLLLLYIIFVLLRMNILIFDRFCNYLVLLLIVFTINALSERRKYHLGKFTKVYLCIGVIILTYQGVSTFLLPSQLEYRPNIKYDCRYIPYKTVFQEVDRDRENLYTSYGL